MLTRIIISFVRCVVSDASMETSGVRGLPHISGHLRGCAPRLRIEETLNTGDDPTTEDAVPLLDIMHKMLTLL